MNIFRRQSTRSAKYVDKDEPSSSTDTSFLSSTSSSSGHADSSILWTGVCRNDILLAQGRRDVLEEVDREDEIDKLFGRRKKRPVVSKTDTGEQDLISRTAASLLSKSPTPGWEFYNTRQLRGVKLHVYEYEREDRSDPDSARNGEHNFIIWTFACMFEPAADGNHAPNLQLAQAFLEKLVDLTEVFRDSDATWKYGSTHAAQDSFGPVLHQQLQQAPSIIQVEQKIEYCRDIMSRNIERILARGERVEDLQEDATQLQSMADVFRKKSKNVRRRMMWQNAKHGLAVGSAITIGAGIVVVPPLLAVL